MQGDKQMCQQHYNQKLQEKQLPTIWEVPDKMWKKIRKLPLGEKEPGTPGRPPIPSRVVLNGILYVLRTGCQWKAAPKEYGSGSTLHRRFQEWEEANIMDTIVEMMLTWYDKTKGIDWQWQSIDTKMAPAPLGGEETGPNPTDRSKIGTKRHLLIDGNGAPLAFHLTAANRHDMKGIPELIGEGFLTVRPILTLDRLQHLCLDKAYDAPETDEFLQAQGYILHTKRRGEKTPVAGIGEKTYPPRRWKVERTISWLNNMRKLRTRWEKKACNYRALWLLATALIVFRLIVLG
jgi:putative transposase